MITSPPAMTLSKRGQALSVLLGPGPRLSYTPLRSFTAFTTAWGIVATSIR